MKVFARSTAALAASALLVAATPAETWSVDPAHTEVTFSVNHFFTPVTGKFEGFEIDLNFDPDAPQNSSVTAEIQVSSINTNNERRDNHLRSGDFFEAESNPTITFESESVRRVSDNQLVATGPLTIKGITKQVELPIEILGIQEIPNEMREMLGGAVRVGSFKSTLTIDRRDFEVGVGNWAATAVVGKDVEITLIVEAAER